jgi:phosphoribosylglycinamide formyltransferase-1
MSRKRVAILISGRGSNMASLIEAAKQPDFPAEIALVISNRPNALGLDRASAAGVAAHIIDHTRFNDRAAFEREIDVTFSQRQIDLVCLAGFLRLLTPEFVQRWEGRMINVHPALLPAFKGLDTHARALAAGVKIHGASVHFVVSEMDSGPIIAQAAVPVLDNDTPGTLGERVLAAEHVIYPQALRALAEGRVRLDGNRCVIEGSGGPDSTLVVPTL